MIGSVDHESQPRSLGLSPFPELITPNGSIEVFGQNSDLLCVAQYDSGPAVRSSRPSRNETVTELKRNHSVHKFICDGPETRSFTPHMAFGVFPLRMSLQSPFNRSFFSLIINALVRMHCCRLSTSLIRLPRMVSPSLSAESEGSVYGINPSDSPNSTHHSKMGMHLHRWIKAQPVLNNLTVPTDQDADE